ncbi:MAG: hypothetical protein Q9166_001169 [cf. Caloplaca sp. 2 TL-2023]
MTNAEDSILGDPWDWTIAEVVAAFCDPNAHFRATTNSEALPNPKILKDKIREHCIDGFILLNEIDGPTLKDELGITVLGHRGHLIREIRHLKRCSQKYEEHLEILKQEKSRDRLAGYPSNYGTTRHGTPALQSPFTPRIPERPLPPDTPAQSMLIAADAPKATAPPLQTTSDTEGRLRFETSIQHSQQWLDGLPDAPEPVLAEVGSPKLSANHTLGRQDETLVVDKSGKQRRKLVLGAPLPVSDDAAGPAVVDVDLSDKKPEDLVDVALGTFVQPNGDIPEEVRKRVTPSLLLHSHDTAGPAKGRLDPFSSRKPGEGYLGIQALPVDDIFYREISSNQDETAPFNFAFFKSPVNIGQHRYISSRFKYFLRQTASIFQRDTKQCLGICPYPTNLGRKHQTLSITIFESTPDGVFATRRNRSQWRPNVALQSSQKLNSPGLVEDDRDVLVPLPNDDGQNWDYLQKWEHAIEARTILPIYGESGSEGEYDSDTWREIEKENGKLAKPLGRRKRLKTMSDSDSTLAIDLAIQQMIEDWNQKRLPKLSKTAWSLWSNARRHQTIQANIRSLEHEAHHLETRLAKVRREIAEQHWTSSARVKRQCESLRRTIYGLEDSRWTIGILQSEDMPVKPRKLHKDNPEKRLSYDEKTTGAETSTYESSEDESLDGFIVDDDEPSNLGGNATLADADDEGLVMSQGSTTDDDRDSSHPDAQHVPVKEDKVNVPLKQEIIPQPKTPSTGAANYVDLTLSDVSESDTSSDPIASNSYAIKTPLAYSADIDMNEEPSQRSQRKRAEFKIPPGTTIAPKDIIDLEDDTGSERATALDLPELFKTKKISEMDPKLLMERADRKRLLIYILTRKSLQQRKDAYAYIIEHEVAGTQKGVWDVFPMLRRSRSKVVDTRRKSNYEVLKNITAWYMCWASAVIIKSDDGATEEQIDLAQAEEEGFNSFYEFLHELHCLSDFEKSPASIPNSPKSTPTKNRKVLIEYSDDEMAAKPAKSTKKRKYAVPESQEAAVKRKKAHQRVEDLDARQSKLEATLQQMEKTEGGSSQVVINMGKLDDQELICLRPSIAQRIEPHQKDGLRFMWREIIEDHASEQGCLLAQTMGLGKTMQVISFLVTVADAAKSADQNIREQIPRRLRKSRTIVLCPPALVENWFDEFLIWAPRKLNKNLGKVKTVSSAMSPDDRLQTIKGWGENGGVLILGFSMLRLLIENKSVKGTAPLDDSQHRLVKEILLERPSIVVADEAHFFKNRGTQINQVMGQFKTGSRIALTGSPLSNNLSEYYALIEWIAPGYLGEPSEFKYHYEEPITEGLYCDSTQSQWRRGLKKLELFKREVGPKIHRAGLSVLQTRLKGKSEFVIKVGLTDLQRRLYQNFVGSMNEQCRDSNEPMQMKLLAWIAILRLICNHPKCFHDKMTSQPSNGQSHDVSAKIKAATDDQDLPDVSLSELGISEDTIRRQLEPFRGLPVPITHVDLAYKMKILLQILKLSKLAGDRVLVFSHSLPTLDYISGMLEQEKMDFFRMDGNMTPDRRQIIAKEFNSEGLKDIFLISTRAGGTGINLFTANRVVIMDDSFNPTWEEQAVGRAYRIGQMKPVFVYRLTVGGTFEEVIHNQSLFKQQLATRAVDKKDIARSANRGVKDYFKPLKNVEQIDLEPFKGNDPDVLDFILATQNVDPFIREIVPCETFQREVDEKLTAEEQKEVEMEEADSRLRRTDPAAYQAKLMAQSAINNANTLQRGTQGGLLSSHAVNPTPPNISSGGEVSLNDKKRLDVRSKLPNSSPQNSLAQSATPTLSALQDQSQVERQIGRVSESSGLDHHGVAGSPNGLTHSPSPFQSLVNPVPPKNPPASGSLSKTARLFENLVPSGRQLLDPTTGTGGIGGYNTPELDHEPFVPGEPRPKRQKLDPLRNSQSISRSSDGSGSLGAGVDPRGVSASNTDPISSNATTPRQPTADRDPLFPILGANTTLRVAGSMPPEQHLNNADTTRRAESEPWPNAEAAGEARREVDGMATITYGPPSKGAFAKFPALQGLLNKEAQRTQRR